VCGQPPDARIHTDSSEGEPYHIAEVGPPGAGEPQP